MTAYHKWLIEQRVFCYINSCMRRATHVIKGQFGDDVCVCDEHYGQPVDVTSNDSTVSTQPKQKE